MIHEITRFLRRPEWLAVVLLSVLAAAGAALWMGLQQQAEQTSTINVFGRRVGYLDRPLPILDDHLDDIVNAVEFPAVFEAVRERSLLLPEDDYVFTIERLEDTESVVEIVVRADRADDAERVARILTEEIVRFVLQGQAESLAAEIDDLDRAIASINDAQAELIGQSFGVPPAIARDRIEFGLLALAQGDVEPTASTEAELAELLAVLQPTVDSYRRNDFELAELYRDRGRTLAEQADVIASIDGVAEGWYRSISPVEPASNVPIAIAMAFAAALPAALVATLLVTLNLNRRLTGRLLPGPTVPSPV